MGGQEKIVQFKPQDERIRECFKERINSMLNASSFPRSENWEFDWDEREPPSLDIFIPTEDGSLHTLSVEQSQHVADFITDFVEKDPQFPYVPNLMYAGSRIVFKRKES